MKFISHRGNINGPDPLTENTPEKIDFVLSLGFDVEIDLWFVNQDFYLGHDKPKVLIDKSFLIDRDEHLWVHCKNIECLSKLKYWNVHYFWHQHDDVALTSQHFIWTYPKPVDHYCWNMVCLDFSPHVDYNFYRSKYIHALCCDYIEGMV